MTDRGFARVLSEPQPGLYRLRQVKAGPWCEAAIWLPCPMVPADGDADPDDWCRPLDRPRRMRAEIAGKPADVGQVWEWAKARITPAEFAFLRADRAWAETYAPADPAANPRQAIDPLTAPIPTFD